MADSPEKPEFSRETVTCLMGLACYWPLMRHSTYSPLFSSESFLMVFFLASILVALSLLALHKYLDFTQQEGELVVGIPAVAAGIFGGLGLFATTLQVSWLWIPAAVCFGTTFVFLSACWAQVLIRYEVSHICLLSLSSFAIAMLLSLVSSFIEEAGLAIVKAIITATLPLASFICTCKVKSTKRYSSTEDYLEGKVTKFSLVSPSLIIIFVLFLFAGSIIRGMYITTQGSIPFSSIIYMDIISLVFCLFLALVVLSSNHGTGQRRFFLKAWMIVSAVFFIGLMCAMTFGQSDRHLGNEITLISRLLLSLLLWMVFIALSKTKYQPVFLMAWWAIIEYASAILAYFVVPKLAHFVLKFFEIETLGSLNVGLPLVLFIILIVATFVFLQRIITDLDIKTRNVSDQADASENNIVSTQVASRLPATLIIANAYKRNCEALAQAHGLSTREVEIMVMYAQGSSSKAIAEKLYISPETVRTHVKTIYSKLGVHGKQELIELVQGRN